MDYGYTDYDDDKEQEKATKVAPPEGGSARAVGKIVMHEVAYQALLTELSDIWNKAKYSGTLAATSSENIMISGRSVNISSIEFSYELNESENTITVTCHARTIERMRAESPALLACGCALISIIDRIRLISREIRIESLGLEAK